jgi:hypothetical protein
MSYPIGEVDCIQPEMVDKLRSVGIRTSDKLLDAAQSLRGRKTLAEKTGIDEKPAAHRHQIDRTRVKGSAKITPSCILPASIPLGS